MCKNGLKKINEVRVGILGLTFKENVSDIRNSKVVDIVQELKEYGVSALVHDPLADKEDAIQTCGIALSDWADIKELDAVILAVAHDYYRQKGLSYILEVGLKKHGGVLMDVKSLFKNMIKASDAFTYWNL